MSDTVDIGAARVRLIVDAADFQPVIEQGKNAIRAFGQEAQATYDRTEKGTRRAADALLDYVSGLGRADSGFDKLLRNASRIGVEKPVLDAAIQAWAKYTDKVEQAAIAQNDSAEAVKRSQTAYKELISTQQAAEAQATRLANAEAATRIENLAAARAATAQQDINRQLGVTDNGADAQRRADATAAFLPLLEQQAEAEAHTAAEVERSQAAYKELITTQQAEEQQLRASTNAAAEFRIQLLANERAATSQRDINRLVAPGLDTNSFEQADRRRAAEEAFRETVEQDNKALAQQLALQEAIATARGDQHAINAQQDFNKLLGISDQERAIQLAQQRRNAESAFLPVIEAEAEAEAKLNQQRQAGESFIKQLQNTEQAAGKTYYQLLEIKAAELGISAEAGPMIQKLKETNQALGAGTISAKQYEFAVRGLPAQFTDVFVSLAAGQNPLTVLLQQGGQVKDMFGGIKTAVVAVGREIGKLVTNPWVLLAAVLATVAANAYSASQRLNALSLASAKGDGIAGTAQQLSAVSEHLNTLRNINLASADAAVGSLAESGRLVGVNFNLAAEAAARWATVTGEAADTITEKFNRIVNDPLAAILDGTLRVTDAQYQQLVAMEKVGDKTGAAALAVKLFYDQTNKNSDAVFDDLTAIEKRWISIKDAITGAWHAALDFKMADRDNTTTFGLGGLDGAVIGELPQTGTGSAAQAPGAVDNARKTAIAAAATTTVTLTHDQIEANRDLEKSWDELGTKQQLYQQGLIKLNATLKDASPAALAAKGIVAQANGTFGGAGYQKLVEGLRLKTFGQGSDPTKEIKAWEKTALESIKAVQQAADFQYSDQVTSAKAYYDRTIQLATAEKNVQLESIDEQRTALKGRANSEDAIRALLESRATIEAEFAIKKARYDHDELLAIRAKQTAYHDYVQGLADANIQLSRQGDQQAQAVGMGERQAALLKAQQDARYAEAQAERAAQDKANAAGGGAEVQKTADEEKKSAAAALSTQLTILQGNYDSLATAEASWLNGSKKAWEDWQTSIANQAEEAGKVFNLVGNGIAKDLTDAATKGKLSFNDLLDDVLKELVEFGAKQAEAMALKAALNSYNGGSSGSGDYGTNFGGWATSIGSLLFSAKGNAFAGGSGLESYRNSVVKSPTYFPFVKGGVPNVGLMGEKPGSPGEAIMPLTRTSSGDLGVKVTSQQSQPQRAVNVNQYFLVPGAQTRQTQEQMAIKAGGAAGRAARRG